MFKSQIKWHHLVIILSFCLIILTLTQCSGPDKEQRRHKTDKISSLRATTDKSQNVSKQFNVFVIVSDALRQDVLGCYGGRAKTPNIDWLASHGAIFQNAYSTAPWTVPSSVSILTGNYPTTYTAEPFKRSVRINVPDKELLLAEVLRSRHYQTEALVENPNAQLHNNFQGFDRSIIQTSLQYVTAISPRQKKIIEDIAGNYYSDVRYRNIYAWVNQILKTKSKFFYFEWVLDPHAPYNPPIKFTDKFIPNRNKLPKKEEAYHNPKRPNEHFSDYEKKYDKSLYIAEVESVDERVGILLKALKTKKLLAKTYIIFTSDHGERFGEHGHYGHGGFGKNTSYYNPLVKVPLIITGPRITAGTTIKEAVSTIDIMPTVKKLLNLKYQDNMQGKSFAPLLYGTKNFSPTPLYLVNVVKNEQKDALIFNGYKLIVSTKNKVELYDLSQDYSELHNVANTHPKQVQKMKEIILLYKKNNALRLSHNIRHGKPMRPLSPIAEKATIKKLKELGYIR